MSTSEWPAAAARWMGALPALSRALSMLLSPVPPTLLRTRNSTASCQFSYHASGTLSDIYPFCCSCSSLPRVRNTTRSSAARTHRLPSGGGDVEKSVTQAVLIEKAGDEVPLQKGSKCLNVPPLCGKESLIQWWGLEASRTRLLPRRPIQRR